MVVVDLSADVVAGAVLCGGASRRMGTDKAMLQVRGVPMAVGVASVMRAAGCAPVVCVGPPRSRLAAAGLVAVPDLYPGEGPVGGVITALAHFSPARAVVVAACDLPDLGATTVAALIAALDTAGPDVLAAVAHADRVQPLCAVWRPAAIGVLLEQFEAGERRMLTAIEGLSVTMVSVAPGELVNVNTPDDLRQ